MITSGNTAVKKTTVQLGSSSYDIVVGAGLLKQAGQYLRQIGYGETLVMISDTTVDRLYGEVLRLGLAREGFRSNTILVPPGEEQKSLASAARLYEELNKLFVERSTPVAALGGGVVGDLAGYVAATYLRGLPLVQMPTTLLAQVDSSIGGKVAVDYGSLKNMIGSFYQPRLVLSDVDVLRTLGARDLGSGLAEVIKYGVIKDRALFSYLETNLEQIKAFDEECLTEIVFRSAEIKARVVEDDEKDTGRRNILNYGHTIGHAVESASGFALRHGEAVAIGMVAAGRISHRLGVLERDEMRRLEELIRRAGLPAALPDTSVARIMDSIKHDKKIARGKLKLVLARRIGDVFVTDEVSPSLIEEVLTNWHEAA